MLSVTACRLLRRARFASERGDIISFRDTVIKLVNELSVYAENEETNIDGDSVDDFRDKHLQFNSDHEIGGVQFKGAIQNEQERRAVLSDLDDLVAKAPA